MTNQTNNKKWNNPEIGAMWQRASKTNQQTFFTGKLNLKALGFDKDISFVIFSNKDKEGKQPDYRIYLSEDRPAQGEGVTNTNTAPIKQPYVKIAPKKVAPPQEADQDTDLL